VLVRDPVTLRPAFLAPSAMLLYVVALPLLLLAAGPWALLPLALYAVAVAADAAWIATTLRRPLGAVAAAGLVVVLHASYGLGVLRGVTARRRPVEAPVVLHWHDDRGREGTVTASAAAEP
jgi:hypothetical protein